MANRRRSRYFQYEAPFMITGKNTGIPGRKTLQCMVLHVSSARKSRNYSLFQETTKTNIMNFYCFEHDPYSFLLDT